MPRGAYWKQGDGEVWVDVWTHMPVELRQQVVALAGQRRATTWRSWRPCSGWGCCATRKSGAGARRGPVA